MKSDFEVMDALIASLYEELSDISYGWLEAQRMLNKLEFQYELLKKEHKQSVEAVPVKRGKWIIKDNPGTGWYRVTCSECGEDVTSEASCIGFFPNAKVAWDYCPYCGADMRETIERKEE